MAKAISKKEIRKDPLAEWVQTTLGFVRAHRAAILAFVLLLALGGATGAGYWWYQERQENEASLAVASAFEAMRGVQPQSPGNTDEVTKRLLDVVKQYPGSRSAEEALIYAGHLQLEAGKLEESLATFSRYLATFPHGRFRLMAALGKAYAQEARGDLQGAEQSLSRVLKQEKDNPLAGEAYMALARLFEEMGKPDDAMRLYGQVVERYGETQWAQHALQRMTALKSK